MLNSLAITHPELAAQWHPVRNDMLSPQQVTAGSSLKVWWQCPQGPDHEWQTKIAHRSKGSGCPFCRGLKASITNSLSSLFPEIATQWHPTKNGTLTPEQVVAGSEKKVWWQCQINPLHEWQTMIATRTRGSGCPICSGRVLSVTNSLAALFPDIAAQWHLSLNGNLTPEHVVAGSNRYAWWQCSQGEDHIWRVKISDRTRGSGCPACAGRQVSKTNSLATLFPDIAAQWHSTKNGSLTPEQVVAGSECKVWWQCPKETDHVWQASLANRAYLQRGCPMCAGKLVVASNSLAHRYPELARQWHPTKNGSLTPETVYASSQKAIWWQCLTVVDHVWSAKISDRLQNEKFPCPFCSHRRLHPTNSLADLYPELAAQWHPTKNGDLTPDQVIAGSGKYAWWKCPRGPDHMWRSQIYSRMTGVGCPFCAGRDVSVSNALAVLYPALVAQWHPTKNGSLTPDQVVVGSQQRVWWKCPQGPDHEWRASVAKRAKDKRGCPCCSGRKVSTTNCVATVRPALAKEWHPTKNGTLTPEQVVAGSEKQIWWQCSINPLHEWPAMVADRVRGTGCPSCGHGWTLERIRVFVQAIQQHIETFTPAELYLLFQQNGLLVPKAGYGSFIRALATGRFPQRELEKFAQKEPSLVDVFFNDPHYTLEAYEQAGEESCENELPANIYPEMRDDRHPLALDSQAFPLVEASDVLGAFSSRIISSADEEAVEFLTTSAVAKLWKHAFHDAEAAASQARAFHGDTYAETVAQRFLLEYDAAQSLAIPEGYAFQVNSQRALPNLMQRLVVVRLLLQKRIGNWSGTGAGKTLSAILASRVIHAHFTLICCPNSVVDEWASSIRAVFPDSIVATKKLTPNWSTLYEEKLERGERTAKPRYLIVNYEAFQQPASAATVQILLDDESFDFIVIDEIHYAKQRRVEDISRRRQLVMALISEAGKKNADLHILALSATPVINNLQEGKSMIDMVTGLAHDEIEITATVANCMSLHQKLVQLGIRWMPEYDLEYDQLEIPVDCSTYLDDIRALRNVGSVLQLEQILTRARLPVIREHVKPKTLIYSHLIQGIDRLLYESLTQDGWRVGFYTGEEKSGLKQFIDGDMDVLIGSSAIGTGIDRLQHVCNSLIINVLPWTHAEFEQLKGRFDESQLNSTIELTHRKSYS